jgi:excinuclease ABC subunit A
MNEKLKQIPRKQLDFYTQQSPITDPGKYSYFFDDLPDDFIELFRVINGVMLHYRTAQGLKLPLSRAQRREQRLHTVQRRLAAFERVNPESLTIPRPIKDQQIGWCSDFAIMLTSILRHKGYPARMRVGFENYFEGVNFYGDHWITEFWDKDQSCWRLIDADVGAGILDLEGFEKIVKHRVRSGLDFTDLRRGMDFLLVGQVWKQARAGEIKVDRYRANDVWTGWPLLRGNLLHDFQALNGLEMSLFDYLDELHLKPQNKLTAADYAILDQVAETILKPDENFEAFRNLFEKMPRTHILRSHLRMVGVLGDVPIQVADRVLESDMARLRLLGNKGPEHDTPRDTKVADQPKVSQGRSTSIVPKEKQNGQAGIFVQGARKNNLKNIDVHIPRNKLVVVTGVSGSGKSSLAFDTIYAEGQRRYVESLSSMARQFTKQMEKPEVDKVVGLNPAVAIEQHTFSANSLSTVGSITDVLNYLRVLFARVGAMHCPQCGRDVTAQTPQEVAKHITKLEPGTHYKLLAPVNRFGRASLDQVAARAKENGYRAVRLNGVVIDLEEEAKFPEPSGEFDVEVLVAEMDVPWESDLDEQSTFFNLCLEKVEESFDLGAGVMVVLLEGEELRLNNDRICPYCEIHLPKLEPRLLNHNTVFGMCHACDGLGVQLEVDPDRIISKPEKSLMEDATEFYAYKNLRKSSSTWWKGRIGAIAEYFNADLELPWKDLPEDFRRAIIYGTEGEKIKIDFGSDDGSFAVQTERALDGAVHHINRLYRQTKSENSRRYYRQFMKQEACPECQGECLKKEARFVTLGENRYPEVTQKSIGELYNWIKNLRMLLNERQVEIGGELLDEIEQRLKFICEVGLSYLSLDRPAPTLSGGEAQRIRLAGQIGSELMGVLYVLDEPSIGLHSKDQAALLELLKHLRDVGNTVLMVEHDRDSMLTADWLIDMGPGAGVLGGEVVAAGTPQEVMAVSESITGRYLSGGLMIDTPDQSKLRQPKGLLKIRGVELHNLKKVNVDFPLEVFTAITGVSGSGKSSLLIRTLAPALEVILQNARTVPGPYRTLEGVEQLNRVIHITQAPIGRNPRSNPGTYVKVLNEVRKLFAATEMARERQFSDSHFSFNSKEGRCDSCEGYGANKIKMVFMADVWAKCTECDGKRFIPQVLSVLYRGRNIADIMEMDVQEAYDFFADQPKIRTILQTLLDVGLGYLKLGQNAMTLSGGEAQRIKLAKELSRKSSGKTLYILDEPTTGLHFADIQKLLDILHKLVDSGNTVMIIEHNLDVIKTADWIIDLGPEGGDEGGYVIAEGSPSMVAEVEASYTGQALRDVL